jgi:anion-transporting  ArsA/GET3 family ATPase
MPPRRERRRAEPPLGMPPRTVFVTGKGGVGKTTVSAALALAWRDAGARTLLVELHGQQSPAALISGREVGYEHVSLTPGLWALRIDEHSAMREYARMRLKVRVVADRLVKNPIMDQFSDMAPGLRELLLLGKLWSLAEAVTDRGHPQFEAIVVDAPATGHGLGLLGMAGVIARAFPVGPIAAEARRVDTWVKDPERCGAVLVALPEEMPVTETIEMHDKLLAQGISPMATIVNSLLPSRLAASDIAEVERASADADLPPAVASALAAAIFEHDRVEEQRTELDRLIDGLGEVATLPFLPVDALKAPDIASLARWLTPQGQALRDEELTREREEATR